LKEIKIKENPLREVDFIYNSNLTLENINIVNILKSKPEMCVVKFHHEERDKEECTKLKNAL
jgi:hypothetical protein